MNNAYCNMAGPPRSQLHREIRPVGRLVYFNLQRAISRGVDLEDFIRHHRDELEAVSRPMGYMVAMVSNPPYTLMKRIYKIRSQYSYCPDPLLTVAILGRMSGSLYIPHRAISCHPPGIAIVSYVFFPERYFPSLPALEERP